MVSGVVVVGELHATARQLGQQAQRHGERHKGLHAAAAAFAAGAAAAGSRSLRRRVSSDGSGQAFGLQYQQRVNDAHCRQGNGE